MYAGLGRERRKRMSLNFNTDVVGTVEKSLWVDTDVINLLQYMEKTFKNKAP